MSLLFPKFLASIPVVFLGIINQSKKNVSPKYGAILARQGIPSLVPL